MNLPNRLSLIRIISVPVFLLFAVKPPQVVNAAFGFIGLGGAISAYSGFVLSYGLYVAGIIFAAASVTDMLDGYIARKNNQVTELGIFLDPIADKMLVTAALTALTARGVIGAWITALIISREFVVTGLRLLAMSKGRVLAAGSLGKAKMILQTVALIFLLFHNFNIRFLNAVNAGGLLLYAALVLTILSGADYIIKNRKLFG